MFRKASKPWLRAGAVPLLLCLALAFALPEHWLNLVCRSGAVMDIETCCPGARGEAAQAVAGQAVVRDEGCCSWRAVDIDRALSEQISRAAPLDHHAETALVWHVSPPPPLVVLPLGPSMLPPTSGPPLLLVKSSFLL